MGVKKGEVPIKPYGTQGGRTVAVLRAQRLHQAVAEAMAVALTEGVPEKQTAMLLRRDMIALNSPAPLPGDAAAALLDRAAEHGAAAENLRRAMRLTEEPSLLKALTRDAETETRRSAALERRAQELQTRHPRQRVERFTSDLGFALAALQGLARGEVTMSRVARAALDQIVVDWRMWLDGETVAFSFYLRVLDQHGQVRLLGPIMGSVPNRSRLPVLSPRWTLADQLPRSLIGRIDPADMTQPQLVRLELRRVLQEAGLTASAAGPLSRCEIADTLCAVWCHLVNEALPLQVDRDFARLAVSTYVVPELHWTANAWVIVARSASMVSRYSPATAVEC